jgi:hypothetical protein
MSRPMRRFSVALLVVSATVALAAAPLLLAAPLPASAPSSVPQWGRFELALSGPADGNPFLDVELTAHFTRGDDTCTVRGFYDGGGTYRVRFMPPDRGQWHFVTTSNRPGLDKREGDFDCTDATPANHGPVRVAHVYHFAYADETPFVPIGTTCYAWVHGSDRLEDLTLATLKQSPFNKVRMCLFPMQYRAGREPWGFPFELISKNISSGGGRPTTTTTRPTTMPMPAFDRTRFNVAFFQHLEHRIEQLGDQGVEADLILFHPYDRGQMGLDRMSATEDDRYVRYVVARLASYHNVWWSLANEFDLMRQKTDADFDRLFQLVRDEDPSRHLRSIHQSQRFYDLNKPWVTHASIQNGNAVADFGRAVIYRDLVHKPIVFDEVRYEGDIDRRWGNMSAEDMTAAFWFGTISGTYVGHGETFRVQENVKVTPDDPMGLAGEAWSARGGALRGQSPPRIAFLKSILADAPADGVEPIDKYFQTHVAGRGGSYYLIYFGGHEQPTEWAFELPRDGLKEGTSFHVDVLDTWNMTITPVEGPPFRVAKRGTYAFGAEGDPKIPLPGKPWIALRVRRVGE